jgi:hypothetical protein
VVRLRCDGGAAWSGASRGKDGRCGIALLIGVLEEARRDDSSLIDDERTGVGDAVRTCARLLLLVQDAKALDDRRARIRNQRKTDSA